MHSLLMTATCNKNVVASNTRGMCDDQHKAIILINLKLPASLLNSFII